MTFAESVRTNLGIKYLFKIQGRASRSEYWWYILFQCCAVFVLYFFLWINPFIGSVIFLCGLLGLIPPIVGVTVRRLHDLNLSGWWFGAYILLSAVFYVFPVLDSMIGIAGIIAMAWPGSPGINRFGYPPIPTRAIQQ